jgi:hypothetical protein
MKNKPLHSDIPYNDSERIQEWQDQTKKILSEMTPKINIKEFPEDGVNNMNGDINWSKISDNKEVIELIKKRITLEDQIRNIDDMALINYELECLRSNRKSFALECLRNK